VSQYQKKHSPTHHPDHHPIFISFFIYYNPRHPPCSNILQSFCATSLHVLFGLPLGLEPSTSYSVQFFTQSVSSFRNTCPSTIATCFDVVPRLYHLFLVFLSTPYLELYLYLNITHPSDHSHLCSLKCHLIMVALWNRADHYIFILSFVLLLLSFPCLISAITDWISAIPPHMVWPYCEFKMQV